MTAHNSIRNITLKKYLNGLKEKHNGYGYDDLIKMADLEHPPSIASMARIFGVRDLTMSKWLQIHKEEKGE